MPGQELEGLCTLTVQAGSPRTVREKEQDPRGSVQSQGEFSLVPLSGTLEVRSIGSKGTWPWNQGSVICASYSSFPSISFFTYKMEMLSTSS